MADEFVVREGEDVLRAINVEDHSRYKDTELLQESADPNSPLFWNPIWKGPAEFQVRDIGQSVHIIRQQDIGNLDALAFEFYGDERLWWVIAYANDIFNPVTDLKVGDRIVIPQQSVVRDYVNRRGKAGIGA